MATNNITEEVLSSYRIMQQAIVNDDFELFEQQFDTKGNTANLNWIRQQKNLIQLASPEQDYEQIIIPESPNCTFAGWLDR